MSPRRLTSWIAAVTIVICAAVAAVVVGTEGFLGALVGGVIVVVFFGATPAVLGPVAKETPALSLMFAMIFFFTKVVALFVLFVVLRGAAGVDGTIDAEAVSVTVIVTTLVWLAVRILDATRERTPMYDLPHAPGGDPEDTPRA
jgi:ATP synthase protein I